jgi:hypothetical protein
LAVFPDPVHLYFSQAIDQCNKSEAIVSEVFKESSSKIKGESTYLIDSEVDSVNPVYATYLQLRIGSIIMIVSALEAFLNSIIPEDILYTRNNREFNKDQVQKVLSIEKKISEVLPQCGQYDLKKENPEAYEEIRALVTVRNSFVHLKNYQSQTVQLDYQKLFHSMQKIDIERHIKNVRTVMNAMKEGYIEDC